MELLGHLGRHSGSPESVRPHRAPAGNRGSANRSSGQARLLHEGSEPLRDCRGCGLRPLYSGAGHRKASRAAQRRPSRRMGACSSCRSGKEARSGEESAAKTRRAQLRMRRLRSEGAIVGGPVIGDALNATFESTTQIHLAGNRRPFWDAVQRMAMTMHTDLQSLGRPQISRPGRTARKVRNPMMARRRRLVPTHRAVPDPRQAQSGLDTPTTDAATDNV